MKGKNYFFAYTHDLTFSLNIKKLGIEIFQSKDITILLLFLAKVKAKLTIQQIMEIIKIS